MATTFAEIRTLVRALVEDYNAEKPNYANTALDSQISFQALQIGLQYPAGTMANDGATFVGVLTDTQKLQLSLTIAVRLIAGRPDKFRHKSVVLEVERSGGKAELLMKLEDMLATVNGDDFVLETDSDLNTLLQEPYRLFYGLDKAITAYDGH